MNLAVDFLGMSIYLQAWLNLAVAIITYFTFYRLEYKRRETKTLDYAIRGMQDLTGRPNRTSIKINEKSREEWPPKESRIVSYRISNTGNRAIQADDFKRPIKVSVTKGSIVDVAVTNMSHIGILKFGPIPGDSPTNRVFTPVLLNKNNWIDIKVITDDCLDLPKVDSWFFEQSRDMQRRRSCFDPLLRRSFKKQSLREILRPKPLQQKSPQWYEIIIVILVLLWVLAQVVQVY